MKKSKTSWFERVGDVILLLIMLIVILPLLWLLVSSFKSDADVIKWPPHFFPAQWVADQYRYVVKAIPVLRMLRNTVIFAGSVTVISLFFDSMATYAFSECIFARKKKSNFQSDLAYHDGAVSGHYDSIISGGV